MKNVIILTYGISGSSVLSAFISKAGYWLGKETFKNEDYDTFENIDMIRLNERIVREAGCPIDSLRQFSKGELKRIENCRISEEFKAFAKQLEKHSPWLLKDPRLYATIRFWKKVINLEEVKFILLAREPLQMWISNLLRRRFQSFSYNKNFDAKVEDSYAEFLEENSLGYIRINFEDFMLHPEKNISELNDFLGINLSLEDFKRVYKGIIYKRRHGIFDFLKAVAIYAKNYPPKYA